MLRLVLFLSLLISINVFAADYDYEPITPNITPEARKVLKTFQKAARENKMITGQHVHNYVYAMSKGYWDKYVDGTKAVTGKYPVYYNISYMYGDSAPTEPVNSDTHKQMVKFAQDEGAIYSIHWPMDNPWTGNHHKDKTNRELLIDVTNPKKAVNKVFNKELDRVVRACLDLQSKNLPVVLRLFHEMNPQWWWYHGNGTGKDYIAMWRYMVTYIQSKGVRNAIYMWAGSGNPVVGKHKPAIDFYPGNKWVDIVALDQYPETLAASGLKDHYADLVATGKVFGFGELGFKDVRSDLIEKLLKPTQRGAAYDKISFALFWDNNAIRYSSTAKQFMAHPRVIGLEDLKNFQAGIADEAAPHPPLNVQANLQ